MNITYMTISGVVLISPPRSFRAHSQQMRACNKYIRLMHIKCAVLLRHRKNPLKTNSVQTDFDTDRQTETHDE